MRWNFLLHPDGSWSWQRVRVNDATDQVSGQHTDFARAVADALRLGFDPERHLWVVEHKHGSTHYAPGAKPVNFPRDAPDGTRADPDDVALREEKP